jgi:hypothetical protein
MVILDLEGLGCFLHMRTVSVSIAATLPAGFLFWQIKQPRDITFKQPRDPAPSGRGAKMQFNPAMANLSDYWQRQTRGRWRR